MDKDELRYPDLFPVKGPPLPDSWNGVDLTLAASLPAGAFAADVAIAKDPIFGLPEMPVSIDFEVAALLAASDLARNFYSHLVRRIARYRGALQRDTKLRSDPAHYYAIEILADFRQRLDDHAAGLRRAESDWAAWGDCEPPPDDFQGEDDPYFWDGADEEEEEEEA